MKLFDEDHKEIPIPGQDCVCPKGLGIVERTTNVKGLEVVVRLRIPYRARLNTTQREGTWIGSREEVQLIPIPGIHYRVPLSGGNMNVNEGVWHAKGNTIFKTRDTGRTEKLDGHHSTPIFENEWVITISHVDKEGNKISITEEVLAKRIADLFNIHGHIG